MKAGIKKSYGIIMIFVASFFLLLLCSKTVPAATFENTVYYDMTQKALKQANEESGSNIRMDADLDMIALQLAVDLTSGEGYDFEVGLPRRVESLQRKTNNYKSWSDMECGYIWKPKDLTDAYTTIVNAVKFISAHCPDYNLVGIALIENERTIQNGNYIYFVVVGKGTCRPETKTGKVKETITSGATVYFPVSVSKVQITGTAHTLLTGKKMSLKAVITPTNATDRSVSWSVSNKNYASVSSQGVVTAKAAGAGKTVTITATAKDGSGKKATYLIKIKGAVKKISLKAAKSVKAGKKVTVKATVSVGKGGSKALKWSSSNKKYATVTSKGVVSTKKAGKGKIVTITAKAKDGSGKKASVKIRIK